MTTTICPCFARSTLPQGLISKRIIRKGTFWRKSESRWIQRYYCRPCRRWFSNASYSPCYYQKRRRLNPRIRDLLCSQVSIRRTAILVGANRKTVARRLCFLANLERMREQETVRKTLDQLGTRVDTVVFDEMETSIHTKLKPLSIALAVTPERVILGFETSVMPASGKNAKISQKKYGKRPDRRNAGMRKLFQRLKIFLDQEGQKPTRLLSDECPRYPSHVRRDFPKATHVTFPGKRGCVVGQGELKKIGFDPLFALNHTAAMFRANMNRLARRTWCTTKRIDRLNDHLTLYMAYHNKMLRIAMARKTQRQRDISIFA
jgi:transposase-like protein